MTALKAVKNPANPKDGLQFCKVCGKQLVHHKDLNCWDEATDAFEASYFFHERMRAEGFKPTWELVERAFRAGYVTINREVMKHEGRRYRQSREMHKAATKRAS